MNQQAHSMRAWHPLVQHCVLAGAALLGVHSGAQAQSLVAFSSASLGNPPTPWQAAGLPGGNIALTQFSVVQWEGEKVLSVATDRSYGMLQHRFPQPSAAGSLQWRWRLEKAMPQAHLERKDGDDAPLKVCALFDMPLEALGLLERAKLRMARAASGTVLPAATICYVWDAHLAPGTRLPNVYSPRVRYWVLDSGDAQLHQWVNHSRNLAADFLALFGDETQVVPPLLAIALGADSDNTGSSSLGLIGDVSLVKQ